MSETSFIGYNNYYDACHTSASRNLTTISHILHPSLSSPLPHLPLLLFIPPPVCQDCVRLTEDQYTSLTELVTDPLFRRAVLRAAYPSWQKLMEGAGKVKGFVWIVHYLWLGALKFALLSKNVKDASNLYDEIYTIFERQAERFFDVLHSRLSFKPPFRMRLAFNHVSDGLFQLKLDLYAMSNTPQCEGAPVLSCQEAGRNVRMLSSKAMHIKRDSPWPRSAWFLPRHLSPNLIQQAIDKDGAGILYTM